uniref:Secreted protein n=1 Tax=Panagrellus redivivus TaxID=6233 RepID=A0A7E4VUD0_PANRE
MKFLQLLCIALLLSTAFAAPQAASNATEAEVLLNSRVEKLADLKSEIEKMKHDGKFKDRGGLFDAVAALATAAGQILG